MFNRVKRDFRSIIGNYITKWIIESGVYIGSNYSTSTVISANINFLFVFWHLIYIIPNFFHSSLIESLYNNGQEGWCRHYLAVIQFQPVYSSRRIPHNYIFYLNTPVCIYIIQRIMLYEVITCFFIIIITLTSRLSMFAQKIMRVIRFYCRVEGAKTLFIIAALFRFNKTRRFHYICFIMFYHFAFFISSIFISPEHGITANIEQGFILSILRDCLFAVLHLNWLRLKNLVVTSWSIINHHLILQLRRMGG